MKKALILMLVVGLFGCGSEDETSSLNTNLLFGQWYVIGRCQDQNSLLLNSNQSYVSLNSGAINCNDPAKDTYQFTGTFVVVGNTIRYNQLTADLINDGTDLTVLDFPNPDIINEITELSETILRIKSTIDRGNNVIEILSEATFEH